MANLSRLDRIRRQLRLCLHSNKVAVDAAWRARHQAYELKQLLEKQGLGITGPLAEAVTAAVTDIDNKAYAFENSGYTARATVSVLAEVMGVDDVKIR